jgi:hypothetical protein
LTFQSKPPASKFRAIAPKIPGGKGLRLSSARTRRHLYRHLYCRLPFGAARERFRKRGTS